MLQRHLPGVAALRDVTPDDLAQFGDGLPDLVHRRVRHVVHENVRVIAFADILRRRSLPSPPYLSKDDLAAAGVLMNDSHISLRDDYEVSGDELDALVEAAWAAPGVYGSRMTGAGFGGCTVSLVASDAVEAFSQSVRDAYEAQTGLTPQIYVSRPSQGVDEL